MIREENECCDCGLPCLGDSCPNRHVRHFYCDECGREMHEKAYSARGGSILLCEDCMKKAVIETIDDWWDAYGDQIVKHLGIWEDEI